MVPLLLIFSPALLCLLSAGLSPTQDIGRTHSIIRRERLRSDSDENELNIIIDGDAQTHGVVQGTQDSVNRHPADGIYGPVEAPPGQAGYAPTPAPTPGPANAETDAERRAREHEEHETANAQATGLCSQGILKKRSLLRKQLWVMRRT